MDYQARPRDYSALGRQVKQLVHKAWRSPSVEASALSLLIPLLGPDRIPKANSRNFNDFAAVELVISSTDVLVACRNHYRINSGLREKAALLWPNCLTWLQYLSDNCVDSPTYSRGLIVPAVTAIGWGLGLASHSPDLRDSLAAIPGVKRMATHLWMEGKFDSRAAEPCMFTKAFGAYTDAEFSPVPVGWREILETAGGYRALARTAMRRLRLSMAAKRDDKQGVQIQGYLRVIRNILALENSLQRKSLLEASLIPTLVNCMASGTKNVVSVKGSRDALFRCIQLLSDACLTGPDGLQSVLQALESGILSVIFGYRNFTSEFNAQDVNVCRAVPIDCICPYLVYRPVIRIAARKLGRITTSSSSATWINKNWASFVAMVNGHKRSKDEFDADRLQRCFYCHDEASHMDSMKECSACGGPRYCSISCQRLDWPGHRQACSDQRDNFDVGADAALPRLTLTEQDFIFFLGAHDSASGVDKWSTILAATYQSVSTENLIFIIDYCYGPPQFSIGPASRLTAKLFEQDGASPATHIRLSLKIQRGTRCLLVQRLLETSDRLCALICGRRYVFYHRSDVYV